MGKKGAAMGGSENNRTALWERVKRLHWGFKALAAVAALFLLYTVLGFFAAPAVIESSLVSSLESSLGRRTAVERVAFNPLTLRLRVEGLRVSDLAGDGELLSVMALELDLEYFSLIEWAMVVGEARLAGLKARVVYQEDGTYDISDLLEGGGEGTRGERSPGLFPVVLKRLVLERGDFTLEDRALGKTHRVEDLRLVLPFASTLPEDAGEPFAPELDAKVNGTPVSLAGRALPFADPLRAEFDFHVEGSDLTHYWAYAPLPDTVGLERGRLTCDGALVFERTRGVLPKLSIRGGYRLDDVVLTGQGGEKILSFARLSLDLEEVGVFDRVIRTKSLEIERPYVSLARTAGGGLDWAGYLPVIPRGADQEEQGRAEADARGQDAAADARPALHLEAGLLKITGGRVDFTDQAVAGGFDYSLESIEITAENVSTADDAPAKLSAAVGLEGKGTVSVNADFGLFPLQAQGRVNVDGLEPQDFKAYYNDVTPLELVSGVMSVTIDFTLPGDAPAAVRIDGFDLELGDLALAVTQDDEPQIRVPRLAVQGGAVDPAGRNAKVRTVRVEGAQVLLTRARDGNIDLLAAFAGTKARDKTREGGREKTAGEKWDFSVETAEVAGASVSLTDNAAPRPGRIDLKDVSVSLSGLMLQEKREMPLSASAALAAGGGIRFDGSLALPSRVSGELKVEGLSLKPAGLYLPEASSLAVAGGALSAAGRIAANGGDGVFLFEGRAGISGLAIHDGQRGEFVSLAGFDVEDLRLSGIPLDVKIGGAALFGLKALYMVEEDGSTNLDSVLAGFGGDGGEHAAGGDAAAAFSLGKLKISDARLTFADKSVDPDFNNEFAVQQAEITGLALQSREKSKVALQGEIGGGAALSAEGTLNLMEAGAETDLVLRIENLDLPPLSPYSVKYIAYPLTRGKLYADVDLSIRDMELTAQNVFRLDQLEVGRKVPSETAVDVPIRLAMSLLTDSSGAMVLEVPVSGRLDDPQFSLSKVVFKAVGSLLGKIVTAPFAFIGAIFGGGDAPEDVGVLEFAAGSSEMDALHRRKLDTVAKAMADRPRLRLELAGYADPVADARALEDERVKRLVVEQKIKDMGEQAPADPAIVQVAGDEYLAYLQAAFAEASGEEPGDRSAIVLENLLRRYAAATADDLRALAASRSQAARDYLTTAAGLEPGRIFLIEHDLKPAPDQEGTAKARVSLGLAD